MTNDLEAGRHILELLGHVGADLAQTTAARGAATGVAARIVRRIGRVGTMNVVLARQVRWQLLVDAWAVGRIRLRLRISAHRGRHFRLIVDGISA